MANKVIIIGAGPAGLTAAYELLTKTNLIPVIFEKTPEIGGISKTVNYKGNRIDIGGHRFFSKSTVVMEWWKKFFPHEDNSKDESNPEKSNNVLLIRRRLSRILYLRKFFDYPIRLSKTTLLNLGFVRVIKIMVSYLKAVLFKQKPEKTLEDFLINRFGKELYNTFFKSYTEKVWGVPCNEISKEWGTQRIKGLSVTKTLIHAVKTLLLKKRDIAQQELETSLIAQFLYPKYGPGQFWEFIASEIEKMGGKIYMNHEFVEFEKSGSQIISCTSRNTFNNELIKFNADYFFSTMPVSDLMVGLEAPQDIKEIAAGLIYRDFITVGILLKNLKKENGGSLKDNWIYIQEKDVNVGRIQLFNNWSPYMVQDSNTFWIGMEYFCFEGDRLWSLTDTDFMTMAIGELIKIGLIKKTEDVLDSTIIRMPKTYPCYFGSYKHFHKVIDYVSTINNLFLIGRNGMHKYNNQDHSMLTAIKGVENIINNVKSKDNIWEINTEEEYNEEK